MWLFVPIMSTAIFGDMLSMLAISNPLEDVCAVATNRDVYRGCWCGDPKLV